MHKRRKSVVSLLPDDGTGTVQVWRVKNFDVEEVPSISHGVFYSGDCYIVLYTYLKNSKERHIIYFWLVSLNSPVKITSLQNLPYITASKVRNGNWLN